MGAYRTEGASGATGYLLKGTKGGRFCFGKRKVGARLVEWENSTLLSAGFEPVGDNLWKREGILYGREAALQYARRFADESIGKSDNRQA